MFIFDYKKTLINGLNNYHLVFKCKKKIQEQD